MDAHPVDGATPPDVFTRWMNAVLVRVSPPVGPSSVPTTLSKTQAIAPGLTKAGSDEALPGFAWPHTVLASPEWCHVARITPRETSAGLELFSAGFALK